MSSVIYRSGNQNMLPELKEMWINLNHHHMGVSKYFSQHFETITYDMRLKSFEGLAQVKVIIASVHDRDVGYIIASLSKPSHGEIDSLFVKPDFRGQGIGDEFMKRALTWLESLEAKKINLGVAFGNERVWPFYEKYGFYPRVTLLERK